MAEPKCNHDPKAEWQSCVTPHQCADCKKWFMGAVRDGRCLDCYPVYVSARLDLARKVIKTVRGKVSVMALQALFREEGIELE